MRSMRATAPGMDLASSLARYALSTTTVSLLRTSWRVSLPTTESFSLSASSLLFEAFDSEMSTRIPRMTGAPLRSLVRSMNDITGSIVPSFLMREYSTPFSQSWLPPPDITRL